MGTPSIISVLIFNVQTNPAAATTSVRPALSSVVGRAPALGTVGLAVPAAGMLSALQHIPLLCPRNSPTIPSPWGLRYRNTPHGSLSQAELLIAVVPHHYLTNSRATVPRDPKIRCERAGRAPGGLQGRASTNPCPTGQQHGQGSALPVLEKMLGSKGLQGKSRNPSLSFKPLNFT